MIATRNRNPLSQEIKHKVGDILLPLVYDATELKSHVKLAHWNLRDPDFIAIHRLLDDVAATVEKGIDEVAERARQLGKVMDVTPTKVGEMNNLKPFPKGLLNRASACDGLVKSLGSTVDGLHKAIDQCDEIGDAISADLLTRVSGELEVYLWLIESHLA
jgi:starvation-inducible DNA-binding protein